MKPIHLKFPQSEIEKGPTASNLSKEDVERWKRLAEFRTYCWTSIWPTMKVTENENEVTCKKCLHFIKEKKQ
jgi:hypothetical protein